MPSIYSSSISLQAHQHFYYIVTALSSCRLQTPSSGSIQPLQAVASLTIGATFAAGLAFSGMGIVHPFTTSTP